MPRQTKLPAALKKFGLKVKLVDGWEERGSSAFNPHGAVGHHTAGPKTGDHPSLHVVTFGRPDLNGPLCNTFLPRGLTVDQQAVHVVAAGRANHAGLGGFRGLVGNSSVFGTEAEDDGVDGVWTDWQLWAYPRVMAAQLWLAGRDESWYCAHRTWAPTRKIDPTGISDAWMRSEIKKVNDEVLHGKKPAAVPPAEEHMDIKDVKLLWNYDGIPVTTTDDAKTNKTWRVYNVLGRVFDRSNQIYDLVKAQNAVLKSQDATIKALVAAIAARDADSPDGIREAFAEGKQDLLDQLRQIKVTVGDGTDTPAS